MSSGWTDQAAWSVVARDFEGFLRRLRTIGITNIEFSLWHESRLNDVGPAFEIERIEAYAEAIIGAGLQITLHPYSHIDHRGPARFAPATQADVIAHLFPDRRFLERVGHVHLHGVSSGRDHQPATKGDIYLQRCLSLLRPVSFDGPVTLEYSYARDDHDDLEQILSTIKQGHNTVQEAWRG